MKQACFPSYNLRNIVYLVSRMVATLDEVFVSGSRYFGVTIIGRAHFPSTFDIVEKGMNCAHLADTVALAVW